MPEQTTAPPSTLVAGLPSWTYRDAEVFTSEVDRVFRGTWQFACLAPEVADHGSHVTVDVGPDRVIVVRDGDTIRAFHNVCVHRGAEITAGAGTARSLRCPYHAWTYGLDGCLQRVPGVGDPPEPLALRPLRVEQWGPLVFVCDDPGAPDLRQRFGDLFAELDALGLDVEAIVAAGTVDEVTFEIDANWKVVVENSLECYHCSVAHPGLASSLDLGAYGQHTAGWWSVQRAPQRAVAGNRGTALGERSREGAAASGLEEARFHFLFPNLFLSVWPGSTGFSTSHITPLGHQRTRTRYRRFFGDAVPEAEREESLKFIREVIDEDIALCESVQRGIDRRVLSHGRLNVSGRGADESCIAHFADLVRTLVPSMGVIRD